MDCWLRRLILTPILLSPLPVADISLQICRLRAAISHKMPVALVSMVGNPCRGRLTDAHSDHS
ncbi:hypothetical protein ACCUM_0491 [Candidatus Accumulibacter phosphatis]|uniref:Uncharacterized protein n=1 Tax=Candidatus Accumulibacter phosphatis TaxID=327160 RepID=A0A5S4EU47_9PROT|nr:hypothetical protein ACCUM_0491 [Candidatus Accumulibacter phosphatis]